MCKRKTRRSSVLWLQTGLSSLSSITPLDTRQLSRPSCRERARPHTADARSHYQSEAQLTLALPERRGDIGLHTGSSEGWILGSVQISQLCITSYASECHGILLEEVSSSELTCAHAHKLMAFTSLKQSPTLYV